MVLKHVVFSLVAALALAGCVIVEPSDPGDPPILNIFEKRADGTTRLAYSNDPNLRPRRTTCDDGRLPNEFLGRDDSPATWNEFYVLEPGQTEVTFVMSVFSLSGVVEWIMSVEEDYAVTDPEAELLPYGVTVFGLSPRPPYTSITQREFSLERRRSSGARAGIGAIVETGSAGGLERDEGKFILFDAACRRGN